MSNNEGDLFVNNIFIFLIGVVIVASTAFIFASNATQNLHESQRPSGTLASRIDPVGHVNTGADTISMAKQVASPVAEATPASAAEPVATTAGDPGKAAYGKVCFACHDQGIAGAPKYGDMAAWEARLNQGREVNVSNAINGYTGSTGMMPARGGNPAMTDEEVTAAVDYMLEAVGGGTGASAAGEEPTPVLEEPQAMATDPAETAAAMADSGRGKEVYDAACFVCHTPGAAGAPRLGDGSAWAPRIDKGADALYHNSINGYMGSTGLMPPKGGRPDFSDDDVKAAVDYMVSQSK